jgi:Lar family restriction alleviation protein
MVDNKINEIKYDEDEAIEVPDLACCPFCGGEAEIQIEEAYSLDSCYTYIGCKECSARMTFWKSESEMIEAWNKRANPSN